MTPLFTLIITSIVAVGPTYTQDVRRVAGLTEVQCTQQKTVEYDKAVKEQKNVVLKCVKQ